MPAKFHARSRQLLDFRSRRDATIGLATMETDAKKYTKHTASELSAAERDTLNDWVRNPSG